MKNFLHSLRWRLQAWHGLLLLLVIFGFTLPTCHLARESQLQRIDRELARLERSLVRSLMDAVQGYQPDPAKSSADRPFLPFPEFVRLLSSRTVRVPANLSSQFQGDEPGHAYFSMRDKDGKVVVKSENAPDDIEFLPIPNNDIVEGSRSVAKRRECQRSSSYGLQIVVGRDITPDLLEMQHMVTTQVLVGLGVWLFGLIGGWWLSGRAIQPIQTISQTASRIAEGNLEERINITETDGELGQLSQVLNQTFARLHDAFERQRQFTADASHELRTPVSILISETQRILKRERTAEEYREALQTCGETAQRMRRLIEALLLLARQDARTERVPNTICDLSSVLRDVVTHLQPLADGQGHRLETNLVTTPCQADAEAVAVLATNLISNGLQHGGHVTVACRAEPKEAVFTVKDDGPGITEADLPHIFERFYRADPVRSSRSGHSGLGLAIAKAIVDNHGGSIRVVSKVGEGACFEVRLPG